MIRILARHALALLVFAALAPEATAALPGRLDSADLIRLAAYGTGRVDASGPGFFTAAGPEGTYAFGEPGCDGEGWSYRPVTHPRAVLQVVVPAGARRMDLLLRPAHGPRDLTVTLGDRELGTHPLEEGWQRAGLAIKPDDAGRRRLTMTFSKVTRPAPEGPGMPRDVRALLHAVVFDTEAAPPGEAPAGPLAAGDVLWLERGVQVTMPAPLQPEQALETSGVRLRGDASKLRVVVERISAEGAVDRVAALPAALQMPWNLDLSRGGRRSPVWLRLGVEGEGGGAAGLVAPTLTVPGTRSETPPAKTTADKIILVGVRGLRATDVGEDDLPDATLLTSAWTSALDLRPAVASLWTGRYPAGHGVQARSDRLNDEIPTLAKSLRDAGWDTILRAGPVPLGGEASPVRGFDDSLLASGGDLLPHAAPVLTSLVDALREAGDGKVFAAALLGDTGPPWLPRGEAWKEHWGGRGDPPWDPATTREVLSDVRAGRRTLDQRDRAFLEVLRKGKADEVMAAVGDFVKQARTLAPDAVVVVAGVGAGALPGDVAMHTEVAHVPAWVVGAPVPASDSAVDLTDLAATVWGLAGVDPPDGVQGVDVRAIVPAAWPTPAFSAHREAALVVQGERALLEPGGDEPSRWLARGDEGWARTETSDTESLREALLRRELRAWRAAGARWRETESSASATWEGPQGHATTCDR
ncbi:MAG: hypothetical protein ACQEXJ_16515 [Myxococcota bacterium]